jgi:hypothetical protein
VRRVVLEQPEAFDATLREELRGRESVLVRVTAANGKDGKPWCSDCARFEPVLQAVLEGADRQVTLLDCLVVRDAYKQGEHPYRKHPLLQIKAIPTLLRVDAAGVAQARLVEAECFDAKSVERVVFPHRASN